MHRTCSLLCLTMLVPTMAAQAADCDGLEDVRQKAECIHDTLAPDVVLRLLRLAISTVHGDPTKVPPSNDFLYIAEEAGEAARRTELRPLVGLASSTDLTKVVFAARAIGSFLDAVEHGFSHNRRFDGKGAPEIFAKARKVLRGPCKRLAKHKSATVQADGKRCLDAIDRDAEAMGRLLSEPASFQGIGPVEVGAGGGHLGGIRVDAPRTTRASKRTDE